MPTYEITVKVNVAGVGERTTVLSVPAATLEEAITLAKRDVSIVVVTAARLAP